MTLTGLSLAYLRDRPLTAVLNVVLVALAVGSMTVLLLFTGQLEQRFGRDARPVDLVVGPEGSPLSLMLATVLHADVPNGTIPRETLTDLRAHAMVRTAVPLALGDSFEGFRIVGTDAGYPALYAARPSQGRLFAAPMEAVIGADVARSGKLRLGQGFAGAHGLAMTDAAHDATPFTVVGVLAPTGSVLDRLIITPVESVWQAHAAERRADDPPPGLSAVLVQYRTSMAAIRLPREMDDRPGLQAAAPAVEVAKLLRLVGVGLDAVQGLAAVLLLTGGLSILVALYTALHGREGDMAMLRVMGARPGAIFGQVVLEGLLLAGAGALLGVLLGHAVVGIAVATLPRFRDLGLTGFAVQPAEALVVAAALAVGAVAALLPALRVFRVDVADTLARS